MSNIFYDYKQAEKINPLKEQEYSRILTAAVVNEKFRKLLLSNPEVAIRVGFGGEAFHLGAEDTKRLAGIRASTLADFARQMNSVSSSKIACTAAD